MPDNHLLHNRIAEAPLITEDPLLTYSGLATYLHMSQSTLRQYVMRGKIPYLKIAGQRLVRFRKSEIDNWLQGK